MQAEPATFITREKRWKLDVDRITTLDEVKWILGQMDIYRRTPPPSEMAYLWEEFTWHASPGVVLVNSALGQGR